MRYLPDLLVLAGAAAIIAGAMLIYLPAGFIVAGILCIVGARMVHK